MTRRTSIVLLASSLLGTTLAMAMNESNNQPVRVTTTERLSVGQGAVIRINDSYGELNVEGWDRPEAEITVIKSMPYDYTPSRRETITEHLNRIGIRTERKSDRELVISTTLEDRHSPFSPPLPAKTKGHLMLEYEIHVPRDS